MKLVVLRAETERLPLVAVEGRTVALQKADQLRGVGASGT